MKLMRNKEAQREVIWHIAAITAALCAELLTNISPVLILIFACVALTAIHLVYLRRRYLSIAELSDSIDRILHGQDQLLVAANNEGELSILRSEIQKMTLRLKENADTLKSDKIVLTDAIADISHQLRTPLTAMNLTVSMLTAEELPDAQRIHLSRELSRSLRRIDWLIEALLKISRLDAGMVRFKKEETTVRELVNAASEPLAISMDLRGLTLKVHVADEKLTTDAAWSAEALGNILKNCVEHTPSGETIEISTHETPIFTEITVTDSGRGFSKEDIPHLFERFYKGKDSAPDSIGIGLALARMVITQQDGTIQAMNNMDGGAKFMIRFYKGTV